MKCLQITIDNSFAISYGILSSSPITFSEDNVKKRCSKRQHVFRDLSSHSLKTLKTFCQTFVYMSSRNVCWVGIMYRPRNFLNKSSLIGLYYSYIYPYFTYCLETWGCASKTQLNPLFLLQKKNNTYNDVFALPSTHRDYF